MPTFKAGFDLFGTDGEAFFPIPSGLGIPANFFHQGSEPWTGLMKFEGYPIRKFKSPLDGKEYHTGEADTIVQRKQDVTIDKVGGSGRTELQLVGLSLRSCGGIKVRVGKSVQTWDVHVGVSHRHPSAGHMTINLTSEDGGTFDSDFTIVPQFRFIRQADGEEKVLDFGAMKVPDARQPLVARISTLQAYDVPFQIAHPADTLTVPGLTTANFAVARIAHHNHFVVAVQTQLLQ